MSHLSSCRNIATEIPTKMHVPLKNKDIPVIRSDLLPEADGFLFGVPTDFGTMPVQIKTLFGTCEWLSIFPYVNCQASKVSPISVIIILRLI